ncbi:MAG TPA: tetratricopeptide repeat protein [Pyrinomonadaceae bacterium]|nr:tetratricopeptide repeat protein [Pyrinomonadaceae bacterium]
MAKLCTSSEAHSYSSGISLVAHAAQQGPGRVKGQKTSPSTQLDVVFTTDVPGTDILLENENIGKTDEKGQLLRRIPPGEYHATAIRPDYYAQHRMCSVRPGKNNTCPFYMGKPIPHPVSSPTPQPTAPKPQTTPTVDKTDGGNGTSGDGGGTDSCGGAAVLEHFLNPKTSAQVKQPDWENLLTCTYQELARDPAKPQLKAQSQFAQGQLDFLNGNMATALDAFIGALRVAPDYALASYGLGNVYLATNNPEQAVKYLEQAVQLNPKLGLAYKALGDALMVQKKVKEARAAYAQAYELGFTPSDTNVNVARQLVKSGHWVEALAALQPIAKESPSSEVYILIGDSYAGQKKTINAFQAYTKATELDQSSARAFYKLGELQFRARNYEAAKQALEKAARTLDPEGRMIDLRRANKMIEEADSKLRKIEKRLNK